MSDLLGEALFLCCRRSKAIRSEIRTWNRTEIMDGEWQCVTAGLQPEEKARWIEAAKMFVALIDEAKKK